MADWTDDGFSRMERQREESARQDEMQLHRAKIIEREFEPFHAALIAELGARVSEYNGKADGKGLAVRINIQPTDSNGGMLMQRLNGEFPDWTVRVQLSRNRVLIFGLPGEAGSQETIEFSVDRKDRLIAAFRGVIFTDAAELSVAVLKPFAFAPTF